MNLSDYQRAVRELSFALPSAAQTAASLPSFSLYREMIRSRFVGMAQVAFRASWALLGEAACAASFARYLAEQSPSSPILREVIASFGDFALHDRALLEGGPAWAPDLLRFETTKWRVAGDSGKLAHDLSLRELDFEGVLVCNPTLVQLALEHDIGDRALSDRALSEGMLSDNALRRDPHTLLVYRRPGEDDVHWYRAPVVLRDLLALASAPSAQEAIVAEHVQQLFAGRATEELESLLEALASALTVAVERGVLLGVRDSARV